MRRFLALFLLVLAAPLSAQSVTCSQSKTTRLVNKASQVANGVLKSWYVSADSVATTCKGFPTGTAVHDTVWVHDTVPDTAAARALRDTTAVLVQTRTSLAVATAALKRALDSLAKWPTATPTPTPPDTTPTQPPTVPPPSDTSAPNRPAGWTNSTRLDFSQAVPSLPDDRDRPIPGAPAGWNMIYFGTNWQSAGGQFIGTWSPGSYGGGVIGQGSGHGIGNVFTTTPTRVTRLYLRMRVYFDHAADQWHPISNKFVNIETDAGLLLVQLKEGSYWRHAEELVNGGRSWWIDRENSPGMVDNRPIPVRQWVRLEVLIDLPNRVFKVWQDGVLTTDARPTFSATRLNGVGWNAFRGGGGETLTSTLRYRYDDFLVAW